MRRIVLVLVAAVGCGRLGFDASGLVGDAQTGDTIVQPVVPAGAKIWLQMETVPGLGIVDSAGGHVVTCLNRGCPARVAGKHGSGYRFTAQELQVVYAADLDTTVAFTGAVWMNLSSLPTTGNVACSFGNPFTPLLDTFVFCVDEMGQVRFDSDRADGVPDVILSPALALGEWHHVAFTWDGTTKRAYLDGVELGSVAFQMGHGTMTFDVGSDDDNAIYNIDAVLDDAIYYTRALTDPEVALLATP